MALPDFVRIDGLADGTEAEAADVVIERGEAPLEIEGAVRLEPGMQATGSAFLLTAPAGRFAVWDGRRIVVDAGPGASPRDIWLYLSGTVMGALALQRGRLPLHIAALDIGGVAVAVTGPSGAGKSTLAALMQKRGAFILADDMCVVDVGEDGRALARPAPRRIKLWADSLRLLGIDEVGLPRIADTIDKFSLPIQPVAPAREGLALRGLYILNPGGSPAVEIQPLRGPRAVAAVVGAVYRWPLAVAMGRGAEVFEQCARLARRCRIFEVAFTHRPGAETGLAEAIEAHALASPTVGQEAEAVYAFQRPPNSRRVIRDR